METAAQHFDTLAAAERLQEAGLTSEAAKAISLVVESSRGNGFLAAELKVLRSEVREDMAALRSEVREDMAALRSEVREEIGKVNARVDSLEAKVDNLSARVDNLEAKVDSLSARVDSLSAKVDKVAGELHTIKWVLNIQTTALVALFGAFIAIALRLWA